MENTWEIPSLIEFRLVFLFLLGTLKHAQNTKKCLIGRIAVTSIFTSAFEEYKMSWFIHFFCLFCNTSACPSYYWHLKIENVRMFWKMMAALANFENFLPNFSRLVQTSLAKYVENECNILSFELALCWVTLDNIYFVFEWN